MEADLRREGRNEMASVYFKARRDPRVTPVGRVLRRFSLDEIPSLWSVVKGDMSIVGPRPVRVTEAPLLKDWHYQRFAVRPGLTSPWVVGAKSDVVDFDGIAALDLDYIRHWSLWADVKILAATVRYVLSGRNY
jgi:lipopolysaccharide/colanic/teichoic acid biosynthesis glycosyltransferase